MKPVKTKDLQSVADTNQFNKRVYETKKLAEEMKRKTFTLEQRDIDSINKVALSMSTEKGSPISSSEALREIIRRYK